MPKLVLLSSASLYGSRPSNPQLLTEEASLLVGSRYAEVGGQVEVDMLAQSFFWRHPACETVILRPCSIVGKVRNAPSRYLRLARCPTAMGFDPLVQLVHEEDVIDAVVAALEPGVQGVFNLAGPTAAPLGALLRCLGRPSTPLPAPLARPLARLAFKAKLTTFPGEQLDFIQYQCLVDDSRARRTLGWEPRHSVGQILADLEDPDRL